MPRKKKTPPTTDQIVKKDEQIHAFAAASKLIKSDKRKKKLDAEVSALIAVDHQATAPRNVDLLEEHIRNREIAQQVQDIAAVTKRVSIGYNEVGEGGAFLLGHKPRSVGLVRQYVAWIGRLLGRPIDTNYVDKIKEG